MNAPITINPNRIELDEAYMQMAEVWAKRSKANRLQVGALIVKDRQIISDGYNGMPAGAADDTCEEWHFDGNRDREPGYSGELRTRREVLHAESNALMKISGNGGVGAQGSTLYTTYSPCFECSKLIRQAKIKRVVFRNVYRDTGGVEFLRSMGVIVDQLGPSSAHVYQPPAVTAAPPETPVARQPWPPSTEVSRLRSLAAVAGRPLPVQGPTVVETPSPPPVQGPTIIEEPPIAPIQGPTFTEPDIASLMAEAGITLINGVPVERPAASPAAKSVANEDAPYRSSFL